MAEGLFLADNQAYVDWWLLQKFPGKTLEELDAIDWPRLQRAEEVNRIVESEQRRKAYFLQVSPPKQQKGPTIDPADARLWAQHDRLLGQEEGEY
jgi:hypothetical protein